jgi:hypothetical protein
MKRFCAGLLFACLLGGAASAADKLSGFPTAAEQPFVTSVSADLNARFPTTYAARRAGYVRYTDEDNTGAISYANRHWNSVDPAHPSQLWYDVAGRLIGADWSVPYTSQPPNMWGIQPGRWQRFGAHIHYGLVGPNGTTIYGAAPVKRFENVAGASIDHPTPDMLVAAGIAKSVKDVRFVFLFPAIWDLEVWVLPNPAGAFNETNPDVHVVKGGGMS